MSSFIAYKSLTFWYSILFKYYILFNLSSLTKCCLFSGGVLLSLCITSSVCKVVLQPFIESVSRTFSAVITSCFHCFSNCSLWSSYKCICCKMSLLIFVRAYLYQLVFEQLKPHVWQVFLNTFSDRQKSMRFYRYKSLGSIEYLILKRTHYVMTKVKFILSSISNG